MASRRTVVAAVRPAIEFLGCLYRAETGCEFPEISAVLRLWHPGASGFVDLMIPVGLGVRVNVVSRHFDLLSRDGSVEFGARLCED